MTANVSFLIELGKWIIPYDFLQNYWHKHRSVVCVLWFQSFNLFIYAIFLIYRHFYHLPRLFFYFVVSLSPIPPPFFFSFLFNNFFLFTYSTLLLVVLHWLSSSSRYSFRSTSISPVVFFTTDILINHWFLLLK